MLSTWLDCLFRGGGVGGLGAAFQRHFDIGGGDACLGGGGTLDIEAFDATCFVVANLAQALQCD